MAVTNKQILDALKAMQGQDDNGDAVTLAVLKAQFKTIEGDHDRLTKVEGKVETLGHRVNGFAAIQLAITAIGSAIAGWLGTRN